MSYLEMKPLSPSLRERFGEKNWIGKELFWLIKDLAGLRPDDAVLDIGCGPGRVSVPIINYLSSSGSYLGLDVHREAIEWCSAHYRTGGKQVDFKWIDIYSGLYNRASSTSPSQDPLPVQADGYDMIILTSVFTHMLPSDVMAYLTEIRRALRKGGTCFMTFFLLGEGRNRTTPGLTFGPTTGQYALADQAVPETAVAYTEDWVMDTLSECGLTLRRPIIYGSWADCAKSQPYQDILIVGRA